MLGPDPRTGWSKNELCSAGTALCMPHDEMQHVCCQRPQPMTCCGDISASRLWHGHQLADIQVLGNQLLGPKCWQLTIILMRASTMAAHRGACQLRHLPPTLAQARRGNHSARTGHEAICYQCRPGWSAVSHRTSAVHCQAEKQATHLQPRHRGPTCIALPSTEHTSKQMALPAPAGRPKQSP